MLRPQINPDRFNIRRRPPFNLTPEFTLRYPPATVRILIVADGSIRYDGSGFTLAKVLDVLEDRTHPDFPQYVRFNITKAHRGMVVSGVTPGFTDFEFTENSLNDFDEVWLFGITSSAPGLSDTELRVVSQFMDAGKGVLAMGDHQGLGLNLCGGVPRVRSMRRWWFSGGGPGLPAGELDSPDVSGASLKDTIVPGPGASQGDDIPQIIEPKYYRGRFFGSSVPHPILCGPRGVINVLPDHQHEGQCEVPTDLGKSDTFDGFTIEEYPDSVVPEIIATGTARTGERFGLISAYDGHRVTSKNVGRVVTDATWHHWFNTNLDGLALANTDDWLDIAAYFRNVAIWLAPKDRLRAMRRAGQRIILWRYPLIELLPGLTRERLRQIDPDILIRWGRTALDASGRRASRCEVLLFVRDLLLEAKHFKAARLFDPWDPKDPIGPKVDPAIHELMLNELAGATLIGAAIGMADTLGWDDQRKMDKMINGSKAIKLDKAMCDGAVEAFEIASDRLSAMLTKTNKDIKSLKLGN